MISAFLLRFRCANPAAAKKLASVLSPDNRAIPSDQRFSVSLESSSLTIRVESERARSGLTTVLGVLRDASLFTEIWLISRAKGG